MSNSIGCLVVDVAGQSLDAEDRSIIAHPLVGGIILFARNYASRAQLSALCQDLRAIRKQPLLLMVDQEGGRVQRFIDEFTRLPAMGAFGELYDQQPADALRLAKDCGWLMASEVLSAGIDLSLGPVLDCNKGLNAVIARRAFHREPEIIVQLAVAYSEGMREAGMAPVGKHFPGHGSVTVDSHVAMPEDSRAYTEIEAVDLLPFMSMIRQGITGIMTSHILFPQVDEKPIGYSVKWIGQILKKKLGFNGVILSDDLNMKGAHFAHDREADYAERVLLARAAGIDFTLLCNNRPAVQQVLNKIPAEQQQVPAEKWQPLCGDFCHAPANILTERYKKLSALIANMQ